MSPEEFEKWNEVLGDLPADEAGDQWTGMAWRILSAKAERLEDYEPPNPAAEYANAICWAAFWLALGGVLVALILAA